jgi:hypothetical protein
LAADDGLVRAVCGLRRLQSLQLDATSCTDASVGLLSAPHACPALQTLQLHRCRLLTDRALWLLAAAPFAPLLRALTFGGCPAQLGGGLATLCDAARGVAALSLGGCGLVERGALRGVRDHLQWALRALNLRGCAFLDGCALGNLLGPPTHEASLAEALPLLQRLDVCDCPHLDLRTLAKCLAAAPCAQNALATLSCCGLASGAAIGEDGAVLSALGAACPLLTSLNLSGTAVSDAGALALLAACPSLKELLLDSCPNLKGGLVAAIADALCPGSASANASEPPAGNAACLQTLSVVGCEAVPRAAVEELRQLCDAYGGLMAVRF